MENPLAPVVIAVEPHLGQRSCDLLTNSGLGYLLESNSFGIDFELIICVTNFAPA